MGAARDPARRDHLAFDDYLLDCVAQIRERAAQHRHRLAHALWAARPIRRHGSVREIWREIGVSRSQIALVEDLLVGPADELFAIFGCHSLPPSGASGMCRAACAAMTA